MTLQSELDVFKAAWLDRVGPDAAKLVADDIDQLRELLAKSLKAGDEFPSLKLQDGSRVAVDIGDIVARGPAVVTFYRGGWCPYCNMELRAYQKILPEIEQLGATLIAVSPEEPDHTIETAEKNGVAFAVLSDARGRLADALGIRFELSPTIKALYQKFGHDLAQRNGDDRWSLPMPATYVVAQGGTIAHAEVDPDYRRRLDPQVALAAVRQLVSKVA